MPAPETSDRGFSRWIEAPTRGTSLEGAVGTERRASPRQLLREPIAARVKGLHYARVLNISRRGALTETATSLRPLARHELAILFPDGPFVALATVQRCRAWGQVADAQGRRILFYRTAFEFDDLSRPSVEFLEHNLSVLAADAADSRPPMPAREAERAALLAERRLARAGGPIRIRVATKRTPQDQGSSAEHRGVRKAATVADPIR